ncbi:phospholipase D-like domain-containing protein [Caballeronia glebae]|uniref:phospholipase D-like domain-containing protein n=1 Tax=Caballeronia glebae TaxID=1777143 RepID=UPI0038BDC00A
MSDTTAITTPIAQSCGNTATLTLPHYVQKAEYNPKKCTHHPLVCGEEAFGALYDAISAAQHTIDIVCWGFQPSMYFKRGTSGQGSVPIGQLLLAQASQNKKVRLLVWGDSLHLAQFGENMMPGGRFTTAKDNRNSTQKEFDAWWYRHVKMDKRSVTTGLTPSPVPTIVRDPAFNNIEFATRDFDMFDRAEIAWRSAYDSEYSGRSTGAKIKRGGAYAAFPSHHQKMVLIDFEHPESASGFVMGHNTLDEYWDTSSHSSLRMHAQMGRNGFHPRQDFSAKVTGPILIDLNKNFCQAWDAATRQQLGKQRESAEEPALRCSQNDIAVMAQILRTQPQYGVRDIEALYLQAVNNTSNFIYIENQYLRFPPLADKLRKLSSAYQAGGRKKPLYLFVLTNSSDEGMGDGTVNTYQMLNALGRADVLPGVAKLERADDLSKQYDEALEKNKQVSQALDGAMKMPVNPFSAQAQGAVNYLAMAQQEAAVASQRVAELKEQLDKAKSEDPTQLDIDGLKVHICTLVPPDTPGGAKWDEVYIHSKVMVIDDVFLTHGSANVNVRSMEVDSELNLCHESMRVTQPLREKLWSIHTKGQGVGQKDANGRLDAESAFTKWSEIIRENKKRNKAKASPYASLVEFYRDNPKRTYID